MGDLPHGALVKAMEGLRVKPPSEAERGLLMRPGDGLGFFEPRPKPTEAENSLLMENVFTQTLSLSFLQRPSVWLCDHSVEELSWQLLTTSSVSFFTQKHSSHSSFEEEHHQIHPTDVS